MCPVISDLNYIYVIHIYYSHVHNNKYMLIYVYITIFAITLSLACLKCNLKSPKIFLYIIENCDIVIKMT